MKRFQYGFLTGKGDWNDYEAIPPHQECDLSLIPYTVAIKFSEVSERENMGGNWPPTSFMPRSKMCESLTLHTQTAVFFYYTLFVFVFPNIFIVNQYFIFDVQLPTPTLMKVIPASKSSDTMRTETNMKRAKSTQKFSRLEFSEPYLKNEHVDIKVSTETLICIQVFCVTVVLCICVCFSCKIGFIFGSVVSYILLYQVI